MNLKIIQTSDGSDTIYNSELNETYHSLHGSINESNTSLHTKRIGVLH